MSNNKYDQAVELWQSYQIESVADLDKYLDSFRILFAYHSGKIENKDIIYHDTREIFENGVVLNYTGDPLTLFEQQNQKLCYEFLKDKIVEKVPLSVELVKEIHRVLTSGTYDEQRYVINEERPGEFKKHDYVTGLYEVGLSAEDVKREMKELLAEVNDYSGSRILLAAAYLHAKFEFIHPFADGNGRVGRTLINYYLMIKGHPPLIVYNEDKRFYSEALQKYDQEESLVALCAFFEYQIEKTWKKTIDLKNHVKQDRKGLADFS